ncbi:MerR family transcriptional regulator [Nocardia sp. NPDC050717]|uniref:MerR family transcriptional regulator n=1 Tax=Nocardia sp. NPDC050717 TaxID=3157221 RepID=UPI0033CA8691
MAGNLLRIGELAEHAEVSTRTVDHYTQLGLLVPAERTAGNYRLYDRTDVDRIALIRQLETQGIPLEEIATALTTRSGDLGPIIARLDDDLKALHSLVDTAPTALHGVLTVLTTRAQTLISIALQIPPDIPIP